ncbi:Uu.00g016140.m01.CDS01 [Anthostomella pinea]|uniref:Uu.00g016140.m01.CDS01 n=1 Tax=Anthostomella pinea TaxID=933095 RepID=A0AAI8VZ84_9PEZI|nr:Uu.00g016140.m01.CDS01 [Anthostomella pinea]
MSTDEAPAGQTHESTEHAESHSANDGINKALSETTPSDGAVHIDGTSSSKPVEGRSSPPTPMQAETRDVDVEEEGDSSLLLSAFKLDLQEFLNFVEKWLKPQIDLYTAVREGQVSKISFENLWMLFHRSDTIYCLNKKGYLVPGVRDTSVGLSSSLYTSRSEPTPQAYSVVHASGGVASSQRRGPKGIAQFSDLVQENRVRQEEVVLGIGERFTPLVVHCFCIKSDADRYTAVDDCFMFKPFEGESEITNLEAFPLRFHRQKDRVVEDVL